jgi:hypothetical protein
MEAAFAVSPTAPSTVWCIEVDRRAEVLSGGCPRALREALINVPQSTHRPVVTWTAPPPLVHPPLRRKGRIPDGVMDYLAGTPVHHGIAAGTRAATLQHG